MMTRARGERRGAKMMALIVASLATLVRGDEYSVNIERAIVNSKGKITPCIPLYRIDLST